MLKLTRELKKCRNCGTENTFFSFGLEFGGYGLQVGSNESGTKFCLVELIENEAYEEFCKLFEEECGNDLKTMKRLFAIACDPIDGEMVTFTEKPRVCSRCAGTDFELVPSAEATVEVETFDVSYTMWNSLDVEAKRLLIKEAYCSLKEENKWKIQL